MSTYQLAPHAYVQSVIQAMTDQGFRLMSLIKLDTEEHAYYVRSSKYAKHTRLFFSVPGKTMIVMLELTECVSDDAFGTYHYWSGWINVRWNSRAEYQHLLDTEWERIIDMDPKEVGFSIREALTERSPFWGTSGHFEQKETRNPGWLTGTEIAAVFGEIKTALWKYMYHKYIDLQVTDFPPTYCFPGCEKWFWGKFPIDRLISKVQRRIWGSDGVPVPQERQ